MVRPVHGKIKGSKTQDIHCRVTPVVRLCSFCRGAAGIRLCSFCRSTADVFFYRLSRLCPRIFLHHKPACDPFQSHGCAMHISVHSGCWEPECRDPRALLDESRDRFEIKSGHSRDGSPGYGNEFRLQFCGSIGDIFDEFFIIPHDCFHLAQCGYVDHALHIIPARLIMRAVCGVAAGCIMHDRHAPELKKRRADSKNIRRIGRYNTCCLLHPVVSPFIFCPPGSFFLPAWQTLFCPPGSFFLPAWQILSHLFTRA